MTIAKCDPRCSMTVMADELWDTLLRFHRVVAAPNIIEPIRAEIAAFRNETLSHFDAIYKRFDRLENESAALTRTRSDGH